MKHLSESNKKILTESVESQKNNIPAHVTKFMQKSTSPQYKLEEKFKNMEDPLSYIRTNKIQQLKKETFSASKSLHQEMEQISEVSKNSYKQIMTAESRKYDFDELLVRRYNNDEILSNKSFQQQLKARSEKLRIQKYDNQDLIQKMKHANYPLKDLSNLLATDNQFIFQKQFDGLNEKNVIREERSLTFQMIKQMNTTGLDLNCQDVEFYQFLKQQKIRDAAPYVSQFDLAANKQVNRPAINPPLKLIEKSLQFESLSKQILYDFDGDLNFWRVDPNKEWLDEKKRKASEQDLIRIFMDMDMEKIGVSQMFKFTLKKITPWGIKDYKKLKRSHKKKQRQIQEETQSLAEQYHKLLEEYKFLRHAKKAQRQGPPIKFINSQSQTIYTLPNQEFDSYFEDDTLLILNQINKLNSFRERVLKESGYKNKLIIVENICQEINDLLLRLLLMMLKEEKFMSQGFAMFGYGELMFCEDKSQVQNKILKFIYKHIDKFQVQQVDHVPKSDIIKIYAQQKNKNNKILEIIHSK